MQTRAVNLSEFVLERLLHYWIGGPEGRPWVVLTHGAGIDHHSFDLLVPLVAERYRLILGRARSAPTARN